jgi:hypothetical protein
MAEARPDSAEKAVRDIRRAIRRQYSAEERIRIVLEGYQQRLVREFRKAPLSDDTPMEANVMADTSNVALRFHKFNQSVMRKVSTRGVQTEYSPYMPAAAPKEPLLKVYEECLAELTDEERAALDRIVEKMSEALSKTAV